MAKYAFALDPVIPTYKLKRAKGSKPQNELKKIKANVQAFVLLGASFIRRPRRRLPNEGLK